MPGAPEESSKIGQGGDSVFRQFPALHAALQLRRTIRDDQPGNHRNVTFN
jgi:hypothetical protein